MINLTKLELDCIHAMYKSEYYSGAGMPDIWSFSVADNAEITKPNQVCGVISSLVKKSIVKCEKSDDDDVVSIINEEIHQLAIENGWCE